MCRFRPLAMRPLPILPLTVLVGLSLLLAACGDDDGDAEESDAPSIEGVVVEDGQSRDHVEGAIEAEAAPPSGGDHAPIWLNCGFYDDPVPDANAVHSLEHGVVWFAHDPELGDEGVDALRDLFESDPGRVIVSPYPGLDTPVVAVAWERRLEVDDPSDPRLGEFLEEYVNGDQAPEPRAACNGGVEAG